MIKVYRILAKKFGEKTAAYIVVEQSTDNPNWDGLYEVWRECFSLEDAK